MTSSVSSAPDRPKPMKRASVFINQHSGRVSSSDLHELREEVHGPLKKMGVEAEFYIDNCPSLMEAVRTCHPDTDLYVVIGGDGTIAALADIVSTFDMDHKPAFLPLPFGTANMFTRDLGFPLDPWEAFEAALNAPHSLVDVATVDGKAFLNNVVLGTFAELAEVREYFREADNLFDKAQSLFESADVLMHSPEHRYGLTIDNQTGEVTTNTLIVSNNAFSGSVDGIPHRDHLDKGELAVYLTDSHSGLGFIARVAEAVLGDLADSEAVDVRTCRRCVIDPRDGEAIHYTIDGEIHESETALTFEIREKALKVPRPIPQEAAAAS